MDQDRRGFLSGALKILQGAAVLSVLPGLDVPKALAGQTLLWTPDQGKPSGIVPGKAIVAKASLEAATHHCVVQIRHRNGQVIAEDVLPIHGGFLHLPSKMGVALQTPKGNFIQAFQVGITTMYTTPGGRFGIDDMMVSPSGSHRFDPTKF